MISVRPATASDLDTTVAMLEARRAAYQTLEPVFWKKAANSATTSHAFFGRLASNPDIIFLIGEEAGKQRGFLIAQPAPTPPVYDAGPTAVIDDFHVDDLSLWASVGQALLREARRRLKERGIAQIVVVSGYRDASKMKFLEQTDLSLASAWWTATV